MKKIILFFSACIICISSIAQDNNQKSVDGRQLTPLSNNYKKGTAPKSGHYSNVAGKTTAGPTGRWLNYGKYLDTAMALVGGSTSLTPIVIWNDTSALVNYLSGAGHSTLVSCGAILHPQAYCFNDTNFYTGELGISTSDAYTVDSFNLVGLYGFNPAKTTVVDTLTISFVYGDPLTLGTDMELKTYSDATRLANYGLASTDRIKAGMLQYDSVTNTATGITTYTRKYYLSSANWGDTLPGGMWSKALPVPGPTGTGFDVPAGNMLGYTITFKSGDPTFIPGSLIYDYVGSAATDSYNLFQPVYAYRGSAASPQFALYDSFDYNCGQFKKLPNISVGFHNLYAPMYEFSAGGAPSVLQNSYNSIHIRCLTCTVLARHGSANVPEVDMFTSLTSYPNPASENVNIKFALNKPADVSISILNLLGQIVAIKDLKNTGGETITFSTEKLPSGMYYYIVTTEGVSKTGQIDILH